MEATWRYIIQRNMSIYFLINSKYAIMFRELLYLGVDDRCDSGINCHNSNMYILFFPGMICRIPSPCLLLLLHLYPTSMWGRCGTTVASMKLGRTPPLPTVPSLSDRLSHGPPTSSSVFLSCCFLALLHRIQRLFSPAAEPT